MSNSKEQPPSATLGDDVLNTVGDSLAPETMPASRKKALFGKIMAQIDQTAAPEKFDYVTVRAGDGDWIRLTPKIEKKILFVDHQRNMETYLLRAEAGAEMPGHYHEQNEYCIVLEGDVSFDDIALSAGDFHFAPQGSWHGAASTRGGALVYLEGAIQN